MAAKTEQNKRDIIYDLHVTRRMKTSIDLAVEILMSLIMGCPPSPPGDAYDLRDTRLLPAWGVDACV